MSEEEANRLEQEEAEDDKKRMEQAKSDVIAHLNNQWTKVSIYMYSPTLHVSILRLTLLYMSHFVLSISVLT